MWRPGSRPGRGAGREERCRRRPDDRVDSTSSPLVCRHHELGAHCDGPTAVGARIRRGPHRCRYIGLAQGHARLEPLARSCGARSALDRRRPRVEERRIGRHDRRHRRVRLGTSASPVRALAHAPGDLHCRTASRSSCVCRAGRRFAGCRGSSHQAGGGPWLSDPERCSPGVSPLEKQSESATFQSPQPANDECRAAYDYANRACRAAGHEHPRLLGTGATRIGSASGCGRLVNPAQFIDHGRCAGSRLAQPDAGGGCAARTEQR